MLNQQCIINEYELLRRQSLERGQRSTQRVTLALRAVVEGGMVSFMHCCRTLLRASPAEPKAVKLIRQGAVTEASLPSAELTHTLAGMVLTIVSQELRQ
jgi:hypothetical protein